MVRQGPLDPSKFARVQRDWLWFHITGQLSERFQASFSSSRSIMSRHRSVWFAKCPAPVRTARQPAHWTVRPNPSNITLTTRPSLGTHCVCVPHLIAPEVFRHLLHHQVICTLGRSRTRTARQCIFRGQEQSVRKNLFAELTRPLRRSSSCQPVCQSSAVSTLHEPTLFFSCATWSMIHSISG